MIEVTKIEFDGEKKITWEGVREDGTRVIGLRTWMNLGQRVEGDPPPKPRLCDFCLAVLGKSFYFRLIANKYACERPECIAALDDA